MAKKKSPQTAEEMVQKIAQEQIEEFIGEPLDETTEEEEKTKIEEAIEEETVTPTEEEKESELDPDKLTEEISAAVADRLSERFNKEPEKPADDADQELVSPWAKEGRNPKNYDEIADWAMQKAQILSKREQEAIAKTQAEQEEAQKLQQEEATKAFNQQVDEELNELYTAKKLPRIKNPNDENDIGVKSRKALFQTMFEVNAKRIEEGKAPIMSVSRIYNAYYTPPAEQPPGADAPVSPGEGTPAEGESDDYSYNDLQSFKRNFFGWRR